MAERRRWIPQVCYGACIAGTVVALVMIVIVTWLEPAGEAPFDKAIWTAVAIAVASGYVLLMDLVRHGRVGSA